LPTFSLIDVPHPSKASSIISGLLISMINYLFNLLYTINIKLNQLRLCQHSNQAINPLVFIKKSKTGLLHRIPPNKCIHVPHLYIVERRLRNGQKSAMTIFYPPTRFNIDFALPPTISSALRYRLIHGIH